MTTEASIQSDLDGPAGEVLRSGDLLAKHVQPFLAMLLSGFPSERAAVKGTGAFLRLRDRYFILTAGHCVRDLGRDISQRTLGLGLLGMRPGIAPVVVHSEFDCIEDRDVGVLELAAVDANRIRTLTANYFLRMEELAVGGVEDVARDGDAYIVAGYPGALYEEHASGRWRFQTGGLALLVSPRFRDSIATSTRFVELPYGDPGGSNMISGSFEPLRTINLEGCSGGGCWAAGLSSEQWAIDRLRFIGLHVGRVESESMARLREVLVGHHLAMIARAFKDMRWLLDEHPMLTDW